MSDGNRRHSNARLRIVLDKLLLPLPAGTEFETDHIAKELGKTHRSLMMSTGRARNLIRERDDVRWVTNGTWMKASA